MMKITPSQKVTRILVLGKSGQVGSELERLPKPPHQEWIFVGREQCDLTQPAAIRKTVGSLAPAAIVNAAAYTAVDRAESERALCFAVNAEAPAVLAEEARKAGSLLIHYSTDYVFDGKKSAPYIETDETAPLNAYGASKAAGEQAVAAAACRFLVLRTSWVYSAHGKNFLLTMLRLGREQPELRIVDDQIGAPTSACAIAKATLRLLESGSGPDSPSGIYHMTAGGSTSWCGFAQAILERQSGSRAKITGIATSEYPTAAARPRNSLLDNGKFERTFGFRLPPWHRQLTEVLSGIKMHDPA